jgi:hypothetical protein
MAIGLSASQVATESANSLITATCGNFSTLGVFAHLVMALVFKTKGTLQQGVRRPPFQFSFDPLNPLWDSSLHRLLIADGDLSQRRQIAFDPKCRKKGVCRGMKRVTKRVTVRPPGSTSLTTALAARLSPESGDLPTYPRPVADG